MANKRKVEIIGSVFVFPIGSQTRYIVNEEDALDYAKENGYKDLEESYKDEFHYWTEINEEEN